MTTHSFEARITPWNLPAGWPRSEAPLTLTVSEAMTKVFDTNELVLLIIEAMPREYRTPLLRVSKAWQVAIKKLGHVLEPTGYECRIHARGSHPGLPLYRCVIAFKFNRAIFNHTSYPGHPSTGVKNSYTTLTPHPSLDPAELSQLQHEFATLPPMTPMALSDNRGHVASLLVPGGIRVGHLLEYLPKITQKSAPHLYETWAVYARPSLLG
jgi:hypothetical protein